MPRVSSNAQRGFSLIELLVVTTIIGVLLTVVAISFQTANRNARDTRRKADLQEIRGILENYRLENGAYPDSSDELFGYEWSGDGTFMENIPPEYISKTYLDPLPNDTTGEFFYRYKLHNLSGCSYELSARMEIQSGQTCSICGVSESDIYCLTD